MNFFNKRFYVFALVSLAIIANVAWQYVVKRQMMPDCSHDGQKIECWNHVIAADLASDDMSKTMRDMRAFSQEDTEFSNVCHVLMHDVGRVAYTDFRLGHAFAYDPDMEMCSFGFFHGFMEGLLNETRDLKDATTFCIGEKVNVVIPRDECFHGIGHGMVDQHEPKEWTSVEAIVARSTQLCHDIQRSQHDYQKCVGGLYNAIANAYWAQEYGLTVDDEKPFALCRDIVVTGDASDCYRYMARVLVRGAPVVFESVVQRARDTTPPGFLRIVIGSIATISAVRGVLDTDAQHVCGTLPDDIRDVCINGFARGIIQASGSDIGQRRALDFCATIASRDSQIACRNTVLDEMTQYSTQ